MTETSGPGVIGLFPVIDKEMAQDFVYESCCPTKTLGTKMSGYFEFEYQDGPQKGETFKAKIDPFIMDLQEGTRLIKNPRFEPWMHS